MSDVGGRPEVLPCEHKVPGWFVACSFILTVPYPSQKCVCFAVAHLDLYEDGDNEESDDTSRSLCFGVPGDCFCADR